MFTAQSTRTYIAAIKASAAMPWIVCFSAALFLVYEYLQMHMINAISIALMQSFNLNALELGRLSAYYFYANLIFLLPAGLMLDRYSTRRIIITSMILCVLGNLLFAITHNIHLASFGRFLTGIGSAFCFLSVIRLASHWFPPRRMAIISGLMMTFAMLGGVIAQTPLTNLVITVGWRNAMLLNAALGIIFVMIIWRFVTDFPETYELIALNSKIKHRIIGFWRSIKISYLNSQNWLCGIYASMMSLPLFLLGALWGGIFLQQVHHLTATESSYVTSMMYFGTICGLPLMGFISDKIGCRRAPMIAGCVLAFGLIYFLIFLPTHNLSLLMTIFFLLGMSTSAQIISYPTVAESNSKASTGAAVSVVSMITLVGYAIFQPLFGFILDFDWNGHVQNGQPLYNLGDFRHALLILPVGLIIALLASLLINETFCHGKEEENLL